LLGSASAASLLRDVVRDDPKLFQYFVIPFTGVSSGTQLNMVETRRAIVVLFGCSRINAPTGFWMDRCAGSRI